MKKLLSILSSMVIVGATVSGVVACSNKEKNNQHKNENGDSIWAWIPGIYGGKQITSPDIWSVLANPFVDAGNGTWTNDPSQWDGPTRIKMSVQLMQILSVAILANPDKFFPTAQTTVGDIADYKDLRDILKDQWNLLVQNTNNTVEKKKQSFKDSDQKNWEKKYHDFLDSNYKDITGASGNKKYEIEEQNYKAAIMTTGADGGISATQMLTNILLNNNMRTFQTNTTETSVTKLSSFADFLKGGGEAKDWNTNDQNSRTQVALAFSWYNAGGSFGADLSQLTIDAINARLETIATNLKAEGYDVTKYMVKFPPVATPVFTDATATTIGKPFLSQSYNPGQYSLFQKYFIENWFQNEKPLAISKITYAFKSGATPTDTGFTKDSFDENVQNQINTDLGALKNALSWNDFINNSKGTATASTDLLTLNTQADAVKSNILKASVYNSIGATAAAPAANLDAVVSAIGRKAAGDEISGNWTIGTGKDMVVAFFDTNGLNLVHLDGREYLTDATATSYTSYNSDWQFKSLNYSNISYKAMTDKTQIMTTDKSQQKMNTQFTNAQLLWFLGNRSLVNNDSTSKLKFKVLDEVKKYFTLSSSSGSADDKTHWFWPYDFFNNFNNKILQNGASPNQWLKNFITFKDGQGHNNADWFTSIISAMTTNLSGGAVQRLYSSFEAENKTIQGYKTGGPAAEIKTRDIIDKISKAKYWDEQITVNYSGLHTSPAQTAFWLHQFKSFETDKTKYYNNGNQNWYRDDFSTIGGRR
ncbi:lipoprotein [Spiroplasma endosymbiont of Glossina fuscipes fuscipes]|uniref:lipoprotein n=1 Tax=Spiroplasma endosymbiont of Glossina fuscipes fuscipes TaxID=2004463 RepID=UPI003C712F82